jgi:hypothetical protein
VTFSTSSSSSTTLTGTGKDDKNRKIAWSKVKEVRVQAESPNIVQFKANILDPEYRQVVLYSTDQPSTRKRKSKPFVFDSELHTVYDRSLLIGEKIQGSTGSM